MLKKTVFTLSAVIFLLAACSSNAPAQPAPPTTAPPAESQSESVSTLNEGYPAPESGADTAPSNPYPGQQEQVGSPTIPNPPRTIEEPEAGFANVGGVLVEEIQGDSYVPFRPVSFRLSPAIETDDGQLAYIRSSSDDPLATLFDTGIFLFSDVPAGTYGLVINIGITELIINGDDGTPRLITISENEVIDLGPIVVELPN